VSTPLRVVVVGAGVIGAAIARALARAGCDVTVADRSASAGGTSAGGEGNLLVSDKGPGPELRLAQRSLTAWARIEDELRDELPAGFPAVELERKGGLVVATTEAGATALLAFAATQRAAGVLAETVDDVQAR